MVSHSAWATTWCAGWHVCVLCFLALCRLTSLELHVICAFVLVGADHKKSGACSLPKFLIKAWARNRAVLFSRQCSQNVCRASGIERDRSSCPAKYSDMCRNHCFLWRSSLFCGPARRKGGSWSRCSCKTFVSRVHPRSVHGADCELLSSVKLRWISQSFSSVFVVGYVPLRRCVGKQTPAAPEVTAPRRCLVRRVRFSGCAEKPNHQKTKICWVTVDFSFSQLP